MQLGIPTPIAPEHAGYLGRIQHAQRHLLTLINSVLNLAKIESGRVEFSLTPVPVADLFASVTALIEARASAKELAFETAAPEPASSSAAALCRVPA